MLVPAGATCLLQAFAPERQADCQAQNETDRSREHDRNGKKRIDVTEMCVVQTLERRHRQERGYQRSDEILCDQGMRCERRHHGNAKQEQDTFETLTHYCHVR